MPPQHWYVLCGLRVRSALALPELAPWPDSADRAEADVVIEEALVPDRLDAAEPADSWLSVGRDGTVLLQVPEVVRILVQAGRSMRVQRLNPHDQSWRLFLLGSALGYLCLQRGLFPLHAACLRIGAQTVAFAGHSGAGKSTLAAALLQRGHGLLSDDLTVIRSDATRGITMLPAFPRLKLWRDTLELLQFPLSDAPRIRPGMDKFDLRPSAGFDAAPAPLDAVVVLGDAPAPHLQRLSPNIALTALDGYLARPQAAERMGLRATAFAQAAAIARQVPVWHLQRPRRFDALDATAALIEAHFGV
ncbi:hypothetical protein [Xanthomonas rydalmerensis]|uniref:Serine kinase n=1 Tax=Xanthomonas rydalmerensis TaxID=3046274 RepID=A0ABZ0JMV5_9XANT|nr:hypothetical protein [Xanthomonas sp. DM-2023]WOS40492.1 hypothetical protein QN243_19195 [Xanthomonas sp. DM-2023]WOS44676.1 hypothetical protein QN242_19195 [Xanthomonas sp. DM-2023]WOS48856.1 hypothetical protein QN240_19195 [Xanthomonas sp. DM-2023]WOS53036.1 hypothetical protein QN244_19200 [Xanthomonas sp. DM-2023]WOS57220.1 hypothetical protein QN245_19195 [Xanthomonas sp. DM-2023]